MSEVISLPHAGYRYIKGVFQYSAGVAALPGFALRRVRLRAPLPLREGFEFIEAHLRSEGVSSTAFCACELRSPAPFTEEGFAAFNRIYVGTLERWGLIREGMNPVARTNVCPEFDKPPGPGFHAFTYVVPRAREEPGSFVIAGSGEAPEGQGSYRDHAIRPGDVSPEGLRDKAVWVFGEMERRMAALGFRWADTTGSHVYTVHDIHPLLAAGDVVPPGAMTRGLTWHFARPPVQGLDYEMDARGVAQELVLG
jgi:hypothetical protein